MRQSEEGGDPRCVYIDSVDFSCQKTNISRTKHASLTTGANPGLRSFLYNSQQKLLESVTPQTLQSPCITQLSTLRIDTEYSLLGEEEE